MSERDEDPVLVTLLTAIVEAFADNPEFDRLLINGTLIARVQPDISAEGCSSGETVIAETPREPDYAAERRLPAGATCADCAHGPRCNALFGAVRRAFTSCDFWPSRFRPATDTPAVGPAGASSAPSSIQPENDDAV